MKYCTVLQRLNYDVVTAKAEERGMRLMQYGRRLEKR